MTSSTLLVFLCVSFYLCSLSLAQMEIPTVPLYNAAVPGLRMPVMGIGTGGYGKPDGTEGEYWDNEVAYKAISQWLSLPTARRIDTSIDYGTQVGIGRAIKDSGIPREHLFITSKVGPRYPLGYQQILDQYDDILKQLQVDYVDLLLIHWPGFPPGAKLNFSEPCYNNQSYKICRQESWRALETLFNQSKVKAIGVSNFEQNHLQDIFEVATVLPSVNQVEFHAYWHEDALVQFCQSHKITFNSYAPLGAPDHMAFHPHVMPVLLIDNPVVANIAAEVKKTPAQVLLRWIWQHNIVTNPRSERVNHMKENLDIFNFELNQQQMVMLSSLNHPQRKVCEDPHEIA